MRKNLDNAEKNDMKKPEERQDYDTPWKKMLEAYFREFVRIFDRYDRKVASMAVLADDHPSWRPDRFGYEIWGCEVGLRFPSVKLLDFKDRWDWLEKSSNPFAAVVMAHLKAMETKGDHGGRYRWKLYLIKRLYKMGYGKRDVTLLFEFIDWVMSLPETLEKGLWAEIDEMEREMNMQYVSSVQRIGRKEESLILLGRMLARRYINRSLGAKTSSRPARVSRLFRTISAILADKKRAGREDRLSALHPSF